MDKQNELVINVLKRMSQAGILDHVLLVGSWCAAFYKEYFAGTDYRPVLRTRDIDFLTTKRPHFSKKADIEELLEPLGFEIDFVGKGFIRLESEDLLIEFLAPEVGRHKDKPLDLPNLGINAQPMRHMDMLWRDPIEVVVSGIAVHLPHPADYCLQKLIASSKRKRGEKAEKDKVTALEVFDALIEKDELKSIRAALDNLTKKERNAVLLELEGNDRRNMLDI